MGDEIATKVRLLSFTFFDPLARKYQRQPGRLDPGDCLPERFAVLVAIVEHQGHSAPPKRLFLGLIEEHLPLVDVGTARQRFDFGMRPARAGPPFGPRAQELGPAFTRAGDVYQWNRRGT